MDPNNPDFSNYFSDLGDDFVTNPRFQTFLQRIAPQYPPQQTHPQFPQQQTPPEFSILNNTYEPHSPPVYQGRNSQLNDELEETVPDTPQYPPPPVRVSVNQNQPIGKGSRMWSVAEDETLISLYLQFSEDAIVGTNQKASALWRKISVAYDQAQAEKPHILPPRPLRSLESRWRRMATDLIQWSSCYDEAGRATRSGYNEADRINNASKLFYASSKPRQHNFNHHHGWEIVKNDPKWRTKLRWALSREDRLVVGDAVEDDSSGSDKRCRTEEEGAIPSTDLSSGGLPRLDGVKKAKAKCNKGKEVASDASTLGEQMKQNNACRETEAQIRLKKLDFDMEMERRKQKQVEIQQKQVDIQERRLNYEMLQDLISKGTDLTPDEEAYKDELRALLYGRRHM
ncbi:glutathione S-transferase T3-like [Chenopodium quinoa]|uniref:glutathione S-transferase T3-like n=1 Tax=Chenopodium quinoa TaxID=63459 RepID=UPI000B794DAF|nr:glutathione S-transferase T3-like [Chenopodium quinoa]